ncbi:MAG TPA: hypothetical protein VFB59_00815 [Candidatus Saccharimonadales bacterium]|nr:hypothetical protein [Candidatus Saccharimonadales bacterium]
MTKFETFPLEHDEVIASVAAAIHKTATGGYGDIVEETMALAEKRSKGWEIGVGKGLFETPVVDLMLDLTLGVLTQPQVEARLPKEVWWRCGIAQDLATYFASNTEYLQFYRQQFNEYKGLFNRLPDVFQDTESHGNLVRSVFREATFAAGGALKLLQINSVAEGQADIIKASITLPKKISACFGPSLTAMYDQLGNPYPLPEHLRMHNKRGHMTVGFSTMASLLLGKLRIKDPGTPKKLANGCPVAHMPSPQYENQTILIDRWERLVGLLVPAGATTIAPQGSYAPYRIDLPQQP